MDVLFFILLILAASAIIDAANLLIGSVSLLAMLYRFIRSRIRGTRYIRIPDYLQIPIANGAIGLGSELVVGETGSLQSEVERFAILPEHAKQQAGVIMRVVGVSMRLMEVSLKPISPETQ